MDHEAAIGALMQALYAQVSGPAGHRRDWSQQTELFMPFARMVRTGVDEAGTPWALVMDVADYPANFEQKIGGAPFFEVEIHRVVQRFGNIAQVFSTYEAWRRRADRVHQARHQQHPALQRRAALARGQHALGRRASGSAHRSRFPAAAC